MACDHTRMCPHMPIFIQACSCCTCKSLCEELKSLFCSFPSVSITNSLIMYFYKRSIKGILQQPLLNSVYRCLDDRNENQLCKDFCRIKNNQTHCLHISTQQTNKLHLRESLRTEALSSCLEFRSLNILLTCLFSKTSM